MNDQMAKSATAYMGEIEILLDKIKAKASASHAGALKGQNWGHVGDLAHIAIALREIAGERE